MRRKYASGGLIPLSDEMDYVDAPSHEQGGLTLPGGDEVEGGEVLQKTGYPTDPKERVFSEYLHVGGDPNQPTYAEVAAKIGQEQAKLEQQIQQLAMKQQGMTQFLNKKSMPERATIERDIEKIAAQQNQLTAALQELENSSNQLFEMQEAHARQIGARENEDSIPPSQMSQMSQQSLQPLPEEQRFGGIRKRYATGGVYDGTHVGNRLYENTWNVDVGNTGKGQVASGALKGVGAGIASGAMLGSQIGAVGGPLGAAIGGVIGLGAGLISGISNKRKMREAESERQKLARQSYLQNVDENLATDRQMLRDYNDESNTLANSDYYARYGGRLHRYGDWVYDNMGITGTQSAQLGAGLLSSVGQNIANWSAYRDAKRNRPETPLALKSKRLNTEVNVQSDINSVRSAYGRAANAVNTGTSNAKVSRAHLQRMAAGQGETESKIYQQRDNARRQIENQNVMIENQERQYNNALMNRHREDVRDYNQSLLNMRTGIWDKTFSDVTSLANNYGNALQTNKAMELDLADKSPQVQDIMRDSLFYERRGKYTPNTKKFIITNQMKQELPVFHNNLRSYNNDTLNGLIQSNLKASYLPDITKRRTGGLRKQKSRSSRRPYSLYRP
jgi:hypothetical protein